MRIAALPLAVAVIACDQGARKALPPPAPPRDATAVGTITGKVTHTLNGPGRAHAPEESLSTTSPMTCNVRVIDPWGHAIEVASPGEGGAYRVTVPVGQYTVSFDACAPDYCTGNDQRIQHLSVTANAVAEASFDCEVSAK